MKSKLITKENSETKEKFQKEERERKKDQMY